MVKRAEGIERFCLVSGEYFANRSRETQDEISGPFHVRVEDRVTGGTQIVPVSRVLGWENTRHFTFRPMRYSWLCVAC